MHVKRGFVWVVKKIQPIWSITSKVFNESVGFGLYKIYFLAKRRLQKISVPWDREFVYVLGKRSTLQIIVFVAAFGVMVPHTKLLQTETSALPGRNTLLYTLVGPGDQDFQLEEIAVDFSHVVKEPTYSWQEGALNVQQPGTVGEAIYRPQDLAAIGAGGTALTKPTIISEGQSSGSPTQSPTGERKESIIYIVKSGETIGAIATSYGVTIETILWANNLTTRSYIRPGDPLKIPPTSGVLHKVQRGDTIGKIAKKYGAKEDDVVKANKLQENGADIVIGEELVIPGGKPQQKVIVRQSSTAPRTTPLRDVSAPPPSVVAPAGSGYIWPTSVRRISQYFGLRHTGVDIAGPIGSPLYAAKAGTVIKSQCGWNGGYGCYVIIDHGGGVTTLYGHSSKLYAVVGQQVEQGEVIALMGSTGRSTGPHIHFEVRLNGRHDNPLKYAR